MKQSYRDQYNNSRENLLTLIRYLRADGLTWHQIAHVFWIKKHLPCFRALGYEFDFRGEK